MLKVQDCEAQDKTAALSLVHGAEYGQGYGPVSRNGLVDKDTKTGLEQTRECKPSRRRSISLQEAPSNRPSPVRYNWQHDEGVHTGPKCPAVSSVQ